MTSERNSEHEWLAERFEEHRPRIRGAQSAFTPEGRLREAELALALRRIVHELLEETVERAA